MATVRSGDPLATAVTEAIHSGDVAALRQLLADNPGLARTGIVDDGCKDDPPHTRSLVHIVADWPGNRPEGPAMLAALLEAGADIEARFVGPHRETALHWAASNDDVPLLDALLDAGADMEATGAVIAEGTPLTDAVAFAQWKTARRLVERGAVVPFREAAALGRLDQVRAAFEQDPPPDPETVNQALWYAGHGGQQGVADFLVERGADRDWVSPWDGTTPRETAARNGFTLDL